MVNKNILINKHLLRVVVGNNLAAVQTKLHQHLHIVPHAVQQLVQLLMQPLQSPQQSRRQRMVRLMVTVPALDLEVAVIAIAEDLLAASISGFFLTHRIVVLVIAIALLGGTFPLLNLLLVQVVAESRGPLQMLQQRGQVPLQRQQPPR